MNFPVFEHYLITHNTKIYFDYGSVGFDESADFVMRGETCTDPTKLTVLTSASLALVMLTPPVSRRREWSTPKGDSNPCVRRERATS